MQYNIYYIELLGEESLKGVTIPVVVDNKRSLTNENMADIAKILNTYRTVFVRSNVSDILNTNVFSVRGETWDCLYASVAAIYTLTETSFIREIESGEKYITVDTQNCKSKVSISYQDMTALSVNHQIDIPKLNTLKSVKEELYTSDVVENSTDSNQYTRLIYTEDPKEFSRLRKKKPEKIERDMDYLVLFFDRDNKMVYFHVERIYEIKQKLDSKSQIGFIISYLLSKGIDRKDIKEICHVLNTGQYAIMNVGIEDDVVFIKMNATTLVEGILNI